MSTNKRKLTKINKGPKVEKGRSDLPSITARADDAFGSKNYAEFSVDKKKEGKYKSQRTLMLLAYIFGAGLFVAVCAAVKFLLWFVALTPLFLWMAVYFTWPFVSIEYKYTVDHALFTVKTVYGDRYEELMFEGKIKDFSIIAPYNDTYKNQADEFAADAEKVEAYSSSSADDIYFACHTDENGKKTVVFFEMTSQALGAVKYYNSSATVVSEVRR
ncbi:MAG: hypothetical protein E7633_05675 [Ruminococcaceae bacterium]|nr:hypothetical protein [Oscillospiraceae bacterium]